MSVEVNVKLENVEEFKIAIGQFDSKMQENVHTQLENWATEVQTLARQLAPARTGFLRNSIYVRSDGWVTGIGAEASYAAVVEFGSVHVQARPYLLPALEDCLPKLEQVIGEALETTKTQAGLT